MTCVKIYHKISTIHTASFRSLMSIKTIIIIKPIERSLDKKYSFTVFLLYDYGAKYIHTYSQIIIELA